MPFIDEIIRRAVAEGRFDNLPGKGRPLDLRENPFEDPAWRTAYKLLRNSGFSLPWIETRREIESGRERARQALSRAWQDRRERLASGSSQQAEEGPWRRALDAFHAQVAELNRQIRDYNLQVPAPQFQRPLLDTEREVQAVRQG
jgi:DnaJ family protein C protein 28